MRVRLRDCKQQRRLSAARFTVNISFGLKRAKAALLQEMRARENVRRDTYSVDEMRDDRVVTVERGEVKSSEAVRLVRVHQIVVSFKQASEDTEARKNNQNTHSSLLQRQMFLHTIDCP